MSNEDERNQKIWDEILSHAHLRTEILPNEFTKMQLIREHHLSHTNVDKIIQMLKDAGAIKERPAMCHGKPCTAYSFVDGFDPSSLIG